MRPVIVAAALAGAADTGAFIARRPRLLLEHPGRGAGSLAGLALWLGLAASAAGDRDTAGSRTLALASAVAAGSASVLAAHIRSGIAGPRVFLGAGLAALAAAAAATSRASA